METTPNSSRHATQSLNSRTHSLRTASVESLDDAVPPARPVFLEQSLFINALAGPSRAPPVLGNKSVNGAVSVPMQTTRIDGRQFGTAAGGGGGGDSLKPTAATAGGGGGTRKRTLADTTARENGGLSPDDSAARHAKRMRAVGPVLADGTLEAEAPNATNSARRKQRKAERGAGIEKLQQDTQQWRQKYRKAFPSFTFYFDAIDEATQLTLGVQVKRLGASVDNFFSKKVTHVVTSRAIPPTSSQSSSTSTIGKENVDSASANKSSQSGRARKPTSRSPKIYELPNGHRVRNSESTLDQNPFIDSQDILTKAADFGLKIWPFEKLQLIVDRINQVSPNKDKKGLQRDPSLPTLLRDEQLYGTRERDPVVPRNDMYYFPSNKMYLFVEDSTGEHRPVVIKEYDKPKKHEDPTWPVLWGGVEGRSGFYHYDGPIVYERRQPPAPVAPAAAAAGAAGPDHDSTAPRAVAPNLRRAVSLQNVTRQQQLLFAQLRRDGAAAAEREMNRRGGGGGSYIAASGNSQIITSNIASATSTAARSGAAQASRHGPNPFVDKRLAVLSNRNVSVSGGGLLGSASSASGAASGSVGGSAANASRSRVATLKQTERPSAGLKRSVSVDAGLNSPRFAAAPAVQREEVKKPGYCENCRIKYDDFSAHVRSSKHRRFALNPKNWAELDSLLEKIERRRLVDVYDSDDDDNESAMQAESSEAESAHGSSDGADVQCDDSGYQEATFLRAGVKANGSSGLSGSREVFRDAVTSSGERL
ncbi:hypothetical protein JCM10908_002086 [Rhodotorula pacifica]|uniref:protein serine/threonine kinase activating protein DBF4 n=1 Tax=Rhodotorula pacifica TaxID=1495444 RepID=UPI0031745E9B